MFSCTEQSTRKKMILITQILRPGQNKLHKEAARRLWKVCSNHCSIASILHFSGHLLHIPWRGDLRAIAAHFPPCRWLLCSLRFGRCECTEVARGFAMAKIKKSRSPGAKSGKQTRLRRESNVEVFLSPWVLRRKLPG